MVALGMPRIKEAGPPDIGRNGSFDLAFCGCIKGMYVMGNGWRESLSP